MKEENFYEEMNQSKSSPEGWAEEDTGTNAGRVGYDPSWFNQRQAHGKPTPPRPPPKVVQVHPYQQNSISPTSSSPSTDSLKSPSPKLAMKSAVSHGALNSVGRTGSPLGQCKSPPPPLPPKPNIAAIQQMFGGSQSDLKNLSTAAGGKIVLKRSDNGEKIKTPQGTFSMATGKLGNVPMVVNRDQNDNTYATQSRPSVPKSQPFVVQNGNSHVDVNGGQPLHRSQVTVNVVNLSQDQNHSNGVAEIDGRAQKIRRGSIDAKCEMLKAYLVENTDDVQLRYEKSS